MAFTYKAYEASKDVTAAKTALDKLKENKVADWTGGTYGASLQDTLNKINNRQKFSYDLNGDALYQQYKDQYTNLGKMAMQDTMGQAAALTGGYGNSYASTAGNQAYQGYMQQLNNVIPELYQLAIDRYNREGDDLRNQMGMYQDLYNTEYGQYRDQVADWNTQYNNLYNEYSDLRNYDYNLYSDAYQRALQEYQLNQKSGGGGGGGRRSSGGSGSGTPAADADAQKKALAAAASAKVTSAQKTVADIMRNALSKKTTKTLAPGTAGVARFFSRNYG